MLALEMSCSCRKGLPCPAFPGIDISEEKTECIGVLIGGDQVFNGRIQTVCKLCIDRPHCLSCPSAGSTPGIATFPTSTQQFPLAVAMVPLLCHGRQDEGWPGNFVTRSPSPTGYGIPCPVQTGRFFTDRQDWSLPWPKPTSSTVQVIIE